MRRLGRDAVGKVQVAVVVIATFSSRVKRHLLRRRPGPHPKRQKEGEVRAGEYVALLRINRRQKLGGVDGVEEWEGRVTILPRPALGHIDQSFPHHLGHVRQDLVFGRRPRLEGQVGDLLAKGLGEGFLHCHADVVKVGEKVGHVLEELSHRRRGIHGYDCAASGTDHTAERFGRRHRRYKSSAGLLARRGGRVCRVPPTLPPLRFGLIHARRRLR
mmetsp:Transcript_40779/g.122863  ORF Transcript_40779/g.122863 Transcript_40779/m.122863 type:complete len:216 (-) Transcript_40779:390-1037(-)